MDLVPQVPPLALATGSSFGVAVGQPFVRSYGSFGQTPADVAVIMPSTWRKSLKQAIASVVAQEFSGKVQIMLGFDTPNISQMDLDALIGDLPQNRSVYAFYPGYSTSARHGGVHLGYDGGALRILLCYLANARHVAFLDDDNWWAPDHLSLLHAAVLGAQWAFSMRWFVDPRSDACVCVDDWESVGPGRGVYATNFGGFVDPNCLIYDKIECDAATRFWGIPLASDASRLSTDRNVFHELNRGYAWNMVAKPTVYYRMNLTDPVQADRLSAIRTRGFSIAP
jgi:hypothetical protein